MNMPGFSGKSSLYRTKGRYRASASLPHVFDGPSVLPQLPRSIGFCMADCDDQYEWGTLDNTVCKFDCLDDGNGGGGNGGGEAEDQIGHAFNARARVSRNLLPKDKPAVSCARRTSASPRACVD